VSEREGKSGSCCVADLDDFFGGDFDVSLWVGVMDGVFRDEVSVGELEIIYACVEDGFFGAVIVDVV